MEGTQTATAPCLNLITFDSNLPLLLDLYLFAAYLVNQAPMCRPCYFLFITASSHLYGFSWLAPDKVDMSTSPGSTPGTMLHEAKPVGAPPTSVDVSLHSKAVALPSSPGELQINPVVLLRLFCLTAESFVSDIVLRTKRFVFWRFLLVSGIMCRRNPHVKLYPTRAFVQQRRHL